MSEDSPSELQTEYEISLTAALKYMAKVLQPYVEHILRDKYKEAWRDNVTPVEGNRRDLGDPLVLLKTLRDGWDKTFRGKLTADRDDIKLLLDARNDTSHCDPKVQHTPNSVNSTIEKMLHLLKNVPASQSKKNTIEKIEKLKYRLSGNVLEPSEDVAESPPRSIQATKITPATVESACEGEEPEAIAAQPTEVLAVQLTIPIGALRVELVDDPKTKWFFLHIFDGNKFIGSYEKSGSKEQASKKEPEIHCAAVELRAAFQLNDTKPFVVRWNGESGTKQIKSDDKKSATSLGIIPKRCFRKV